LDSQALESFARLKDDLAKASLGTIRDDLAFEVESDASDYAIAAILSQDGHPVAFMSRSLTNAKGITQLLKKKRRPSLKLSASGLIF